MIAFNLHAHSVILFYNKNFKEKYELYPQNQLKGFQKNELYSFNCLKCKEMLDDYTSNYIINNKDVSLFTVEISSLQHQLKYYQGVNIFELFKFNDLLLIGTKIEIISYINKQYSILNDKFGNLQKTNLDLDSNIKIKENDIEKLKNNLETEKLEKKNISSKLKNIENEKNNLSFFLKKEKEKSSKLEIENNKINQKNEDLNKIIKNENIQNNEKMKNIEEKLENEIKKNKSLELTVSKLQEQEKQKNIINKELEENLKKNEKENKNLTSQNKTLYENVESLKKNLLQKEYEIKEINNSLNKEKNKEKEILQNLNNEKDKNEKLNNKLDNISIENNKNINKVLVQLENEKQKSKNLELKITELQKQENKNVIRIEELEKSSKNQEKELKYLNNEKDNQKKFGIKFESDSRPGEYDIVVDITSFDDLITKGWLVYYNKEEGKKKYLNKKDEDTIIVGVIGNGNKGKSFFLEKLSGYDIPKGFNIKTKGLSIRYGTSLDHNVTILDSAGQETPLLKVKNETKKNEKKQEGVVFSNNREEKKIGIEQKTKNKEESQIIGWVQANGVHCEQKAEEKTNKDTQINKPEKKEQVEDEDIEFEQYSRDKLITEFFLQKFIIWKSNILIIVVGSISLTEQKLLSRVKAEVESMDKNKQIYVIHNLKNYSTQEQVNDYIENTLKKLYKIEIVETVRQNMVNESIKTEDNNSYFNKFFVEKGKNVTHFLFINEYSEKADYYNVPTIKFIQKEIEVLKIRNKFSIIDDCKNFLVKISEEIMEENPRLENLITIEEEKFDKIILQNMKGITLKKFVVDEMGYTLNNDSNTPKYSYFINTEENILYINIELPGGGPIYPDVEVVQGYYIFIFEGERKGDCAIEEDKKKEINKLIMKKNLRKRNKFKLEIKIPNSVIQIVIKDGIDLSDSGEYVDNGDGVYSFKYKVIILNQKNDKIKKKKGYGC